MIFAQILNNIVVNRITLEDASLIPMFSQGFDYFIEIDNLDPCPSIGWCYDGTNFSSAVSYPIDTYPTGIPTGSAVTFTPFNLSPGSNSFLVSIEESVISVGCQDYDYVWLRYAFYMLQQGCDSINCLTKTTIGVNYNGLFNILQSDIDLIYTALCTLI